MTVYTQNSVIQEIRNWMRDHEELNRLLEGEESAEHNIILGIQQAASIWNSSPPRVSTVTFSTSGTIVNSQGVEEDQVMIDIPGTSRYIFVLGATVQVIQSVLFIRGRNRLQYTDGGITVGDEEGPYNSYLQMLGYLKQEFQAMMARYKTAENIDGLLDGPSGLGTDYSWYSNWTNW
jgi:hypothetical protein